MASRQIRMMTSAGLIITFLFSAIFLPIVSSFSVKGEVSEFAIKASKDFSGGNAQLPLAEKENKEEENFNKKGQDQIADLISAPITRSFLFYNHPDFIPPYGRDDVQRQIPLYLAKRHFLI